MAFVVPFLPESHVNYCLQRTATLSRHAACSDPAKWAELEQRIWEYLFHSLERVINTVKKPGAAAWSFCEAGEFQVGYMYCSGSSETEQCADNHKAAGD